MYLKKNKFMKMPNMKYLFASLSQLQEMLNGEILKSPSLLRINSVNIYFAK